jgi:hypothetical protein
MIIESWRSAIGAVDIGRINLAIRLILLDTVFFLNIAFIEDLTLIQLWQQVLSVDLFLWYFDLHVLENNFRDHFRFLFLHIHALVFLLPT